MLDEYAREQRLTGILVLDQNLKVTEQNAKDGDTMPLWQKLIKSDYVRDIAEHPEKTYTTRLRNKGKIYDCGSGKTGCGRYPDHICAEGGSK